LVSGAGWDQIQPFLENRPEMWGRVIAINLMGAVRLTRGPAAPMVMFFLSARSDHSTGEVLSVSGGLTMAD
jgi:NAD(P)-dependent dehydrogenase (short-subunit alcohol dehydrogenase family)